MREFIHLQLSNYLSAGLIVYPPTPRTKAMTRDCIIRTAGFIPPNTPHRPSPRNLQEQKILWIPLPRKANLQQSGPNATPSSNAPPHSPPGGQVRLYSAEPNKGTGKCGTH